VLTVPASVTIPAGSYYAYFDVTGTGIGVANVTATAAKAKPVTVPVRISTPKLQVSLSSTTNAGQKYTVTVTAQDSLGVIRRPTAPVIVTVASSLPGHTALDSATITIPVTTTSVSTGVTFDTAGSYAITASAAGYSAGNATTTTTGVLVIATLASAFQPPTVTIGTGATVTWRSADGLGHTTTSDAALWSGALAAGGGPYSVRFTAAGTFTYHCNIHPSMTGTIVVQ
jgi:plastocyanin